MSATADSRQLCVSMMPITPTMLISYNGKTYPVGDVSYSMLSRLLDSLH